MRDHPHARLLCMLILGFLEKRSEDLCQWKDKEETRAAIEQLAEEVLAFFSDADSFQRDWVPPSDQDENETLEKGIFRLTYDADEVKAVELASKGDFRSLERLILERGYLRTSSARELSVGRMQGTKKRGAPNSGINVETLKEVLAIQIERSCSEYVAKQIWLSRNADIEEETLNSRLKRAKAANEGAPFVAIIKILKNLRVHNSENPAP